MIDVSKFVPANVTYTQYAVELQKQFKKMAEAQQSTAAADFCQAAALVVRHTGKLITALLRVAAAPHEPTPPRKETKKRVEGPPLRRYSIASRQSIVRPRRCSLDQDPPHVVHIAGGGNPPSSDIPS